ncbi:MAG: TonB family protein [Desulfobacterium sp.]|jgi:colicin import membrane protein|nr:TonB family protein [Desulfobacterium sp.]
MNPSYPSGNFQGATRDDLRRDESGFSSAWGKGLFLGSILLHLALVGALYFFQGIPQPRILPLVMQMDLASLDLSQDLSPSAVRGGAPAQQKAKVTPVPRSVESSKKEKVVTSPPEPKVVKKPENKVAQVKEKVVPVKEKVVPVKEKVVPVKEKVVPVKEKVVPVKEKVVPVKEKVVPVKEEVVPVKEKVATKPAQVPQPAPEPPGENETAASIEPDHKAALKKKTFQADKVLESARSSIEKKVEKQVERSDPPTEEILDKAFARLEKAVETQASSRSGSGSSSDPKPGSSFGPGVSGNGVKGSKTDYTAIDLYNLELMYIIQQNWAFNPRLAGSQKGIEARVLIKILKNGQIRDVWFETRSGNSYLDDSALKAVKKSNPLPQLPKGYVTYDIGLRFTPSGLQ